jgi:hypothetical protein
VRVIEAQSWLSGCETTGRARDAVAGVVNGAAAPSAPGKTLEDANIQLDLVLFDLMGKSRRAMIEALIASETNPVKLAGLADRRVKASPEELREGPFA